MNKYQIKTLKLSRKVFSLVFKPKDIFSENIIKDKQYISNLIANKLVEDKPFVLSRLGGTELLAILNYISIIKSSKNIFKYVFGNDSQWWWEEKMFNQMKNWSGFFPSNPENIEEFAKLYLNDLSQIDIFGWYQNELSLLNKFYSDNILRVNPNCLEPHGLNNPWTKALKGKKVLVVHPFSKTIESQFLKRKLLFSDENFLPDFELKTVKAVQSLGGKNDEFNSWFEALTYMKNEIDKNDYDICLIGCGAYGLPLAAHVKSMGNKAIHIGGSLQLLFGIKGKRWDGDNLYNKYWVRPNENETPEIASKVEDSCYW
jgi:hypothetical protein